MDPPMDPLFKVIAPPTLPDPALLAAGGMPTVNGGGPAEANVGWWAAGSPPTEVTTYTTKSFALSTWGIVLNAL